MAWDPPLANEIEAGDAVTTTLMNKIRDSLLFLNGAVGGNLANDIFNGNFENDSDGDGVPDFWSKTDNHGTTYPGGSVAFETTSPLSGAQSIKMVHPGGASNGGGLLESDYYECSDVAPFWLGFIHYASAAGMKNQVIVYWYDEDQVAHGTPSTTAYNSVNNPTSATYHLAWCAPPSGARYYTVGLVGGFTDTDVAGTAYFDAVTIHPNTYGSFPDETILIAENTTTSASYVDLGSITINPPIKLTGMTMNLVVDVKRVGGGTSSDARFRIDTTYSSVTSSTSLSYGSETGSSTMSTPEASGDITIYLQAKTNGGGSAIARIASQTWTPTLGEIAR